MRSPACASEQLALLLRASPLPQIHYDSELKGLVVTFRSTYGNLDGWVGLRATEAACARDMSHLQCNGKCRIGMAEASSTRSLPRLPACTQANNFMGVLGIDRTIGGITYRLHIGFAATYYVTMQDAFLAKLKAALDKYPGSDVYMNGHSRGGAMATLATFDLIAETGSQVGPI